MCAPCSPSRLPSDFRDLLPKASVVSPAPIQQTKPATLSNRNSYSRDLSSAVRANSCAAGCKCLIENESGGEGISQKVTDIHSEIISPQPLHYQQFCRSVTPQLPHQRPPRTAKAADNYHASYNVAPNSNVAVVRAVLPGERTEEILQQTDQSQDSEEDVERSDPACREDAMSETPELMIQSMRWGFLPHYQKTPPEYKDTLNTINARSDVLLEGSPMWGRPFANGRRCVVFTQGFFEWQKSRGTNLPHFVGMDRSGQGRKAKDGTEKMMMPLAGLWEKCHIQGEEAPRCEFMSVVDTTRDTLRC